MSMPSVSQDILAATTDPELVNADINSNNCDREPIHIPNLIQPHGVLLVVSAEEYTILQVSLNTSQRLGKDPEHLLKRPLSELLGAEQVQKIQRCLSGKFEEINPLSISLQREGKDFSFDAIVHRTKDVIIVELEPSKPTPEVDFFNFYKQVKSPITKIHPSQTFRIYLPHLQKTSRSKEIRWWYGRRTNNRQKNCRASWGQNLGRI